MTSILAHGGLPILPGCCHPVRRGQASHSGPWSTAFCPEGLFQSGPELPQDGQAEPRQGFHLSHLPAEAHLKLEEGQRRGHCDLLE